LARFVFAFRTLLAQRGAGLITKQVLGESGCPIANTSVGVKNTDTNIALKSMTSHDGAYTTPPPRIGTWSVTAEAKGFQGAIRENLTLNVQGRLLVSLALPMATRADG
jgi:hypothetical protein